MTGSGHGAGDAGGTATQGAFQRRRRADRVITTQGGQPSRRAARQSLDWAGLALDLQESLSTVQAGVLAQIEMLRLAAANRVVDRIMSDLFDVDGVRVMAPAGVFRIQLGNPHYGDTEWAVVLSQIGDDGTEMERRRAVDLSRDQAENLAAVWVYRLMVWGEVPATADGADGPDAARPTPARQD